MKVCLVLPPSPYLISDLAVPRLGPLSVASCLRRDGHEVEVLDLAGRSKCLGAAIAQYVNHWGADCYGVTGTSADYATAVNIMLVLRRECKRQGFKAPRIILGGAHATVAGKDCLPDGWDAVVVGDGFTAATLALHHDGLIELPLTTDIDDLPFPARDLIDLDQYKFQVVGEPATSVMTSFGCPMRCTFCCGREMPVYGRLRSFSPQRVLQEWDHIRANWPQFTALMDYADEWNIPSARAVALADAIANHPTKWLLRCCIKAEYFTEEVAYHMRRAGVVEVLCGVESGSDRILNKIRKRTSWEINGRTRELARKHGIRFKALTMIGLPTETIEDVYKTRNWLLRFAPDDFDLTVFQPLRGSPIVEHPDQEGEGIYTRGPTTAPYKTVPGEYQVSTATDGLTSDEIVWWRDEIERDVRNQLGLPQLHRIREASMGQQVAV